MPNQSAVAIPFNSCLSDFIFNISLEMVNCLGHYSGVAIEGSHGRLGNARKSHGRTEVPRDTSPDWLSQSGLFHFQDRCRCAWTGVGDYFCGIKMISDTDTSEDHMVISSPEKRHREEAAGRRGDLMQQDCHSRFAPSQ